MIKKLLLLSTTASVLLATNGVNVIGYDAKSRGMGGAGIAYYTGGGNSIGVNPALLTDVKKTEFNMDVTYFNATVSSTVYDSMPLGPVGTGTAESGGAISADSLPHLEASFIPTMTFATRIDDEMSFGFAFIGAAGLGVDYLKNPQVDSTGVVSTTGTINSHHKFKTGMMLMKVIPAFSYQVDNISFGFAPVLGLGSMSINYDEDENVVNEAGVRLQSKRTGLFGTNIGGDSLVPAFGIEFGLDLKVSDELRVGASYKSPLKYTFKKVANFEQFGYAGMLSQVSAFSEKKGYGSLDNITDLNSLVADLEAIGIPSAITGLIKDASNASSGLLKEYMDSASADEANLDDLTLEQPWELGLGISYTFNKSLYLALDYKYVPWGSAVGYKDFGWVDQHVFSVGVEFIRKNLSIRGGFNYGNTPLEEQSGDTGIATVDIQGKEVFKQAVSMLNIIGFPAIATTHYTFGLGYNFTETFGMDMAVVISPKISTKHSGDLNPLGSLIYSLPYEFETTMEQLSASLGMNLKF